MGVRSRREGVVELHQGRGLRPGILHRTGTGRRLRSVPSAVAAVHSGIRPECFAEVGDQFRVGRWRNWRNRPHAVEGDHRPQVRLGEAGFGCATSTTATVIDLRTAGVRHPSFSCLGGTPSLNAKLLIAGSRFSSSRSSTTPSSCSSASQSASDRHRTRGPGAHRTRRTVPLSAPCPGCGRCRS